MAQIKFRAELNSLEYPLLYDWAGRTVMQAGADGQQRAQVTTPQLLYCDNVLPTAQGIKSVSYKNLVAATTNLNFSNILTVSDTNQNKALIGITIDSHIFMLTSALPTWVDVTPVGWAGGDKVTHGSANGVSYLYLQQKGCYAVNITGVSLTLTALAGITAGNIYGMLSAVNYLLLWDKTAIYWSSTVNPLDFVPSLITGAGTSTPYDEAGQIVTCVQLNNGFVVYTNTNAVLASFSNNTQFPWIFRNANNTAGIADYKQVNVASGLGFHIALTYAGMTQVTPQGGTMIVPEVSDFLAARVYETFDWNSNSLVETILTSNLATRIAVLGARYIVLSYGIAADAGTLQSYTDCLIYDQTLQRWGCMKTTHTCCFEIEVNMEGSIRSYISLLGNTYASQSPKTYGSSAVSLNQPPALGRIFGFCDNTGAVKIGMIDYNSMADAGVVMLGKYQLVRNYLLDLQEIEVETIPVTNTGFSIVVLPSINGRDFIAPITPYLAETGEDVRTYLLNCEAKNHVLLLKGSFDLTTVQITANMGGRR